MGAAGAPLLGKWQQAPHTYAHARTRSRPVRRRRGPRGSRQPRGLGPHSPPQLLPHAPLSWAYPQESGQAPRLRPHAWVTFGQATPAYVPPRPPCTCVQRTTVRQPLFLTPPSMCPQSLLAPAAERSGRSGGAPMPAPAGAQTEDDDASECRHQPRHRPGRVPGCKRGLVLRISGPLEPRPNSASPGPLAGSCQSCVAQDESVEVQAESTPRPTRRWPAAVPPPYAICAAASQLPGMPGYSLPPPAYMVPVSWEGQRGYMVIRGRSRAAHHPCTQPYGGTASTAPAGPGMGGPPGALWGPCQEAAFQQQLTSLLFLARTRQRLCRQDAELQCCTPPAAAAAAPPSSPRMQA